MIKYWFNLVQEKKRKGNKGWTTYYKLGKFIVNIFYPISQRFNKSCGVDNEGKVIISLTSFPGRINTVWVTIASLLNQTVKPKRVILWLAEEQFPEKKLPSSLTRLAKRGLEIRFCDDLRPHKKYFYTMQEFPEDYVMTADDDIFYPENHIEKLIESSNKWSETVICRWSHDIAFDKNGNILAYNEWPDECGISPSLSILPVGCNGVLYPPHSLNEEVFNKGKLIELALNVDDLWLKCMGLLNKTLAVNCEETPVIFFNNVFSQAKGLWKVNASDGLNRNDVSWNKLMEEYPNALEILKNSVMEKRNES